MYIMKLENFMKPYGITGKKLDKMLDDHFVTPLVSHNMSNKLSMKAFKGFASELHDKMTEME